MCRGWCAKHHDALRSDYIPCERIPISMFWTTCRATLIAHKSTQYSNSRYSGKPSCLEKCSKYCISYPCYLVESQLKCTVSSHYIVVIAVHGFREVSGCRMYLDSSAMPCAASNIASAASSYAVSSYSLKSGTSSRRIHPFNLRMLWRTAMA